MIRTELDAAGIEDVRLRAAYRRCRQSPPNTAARIPGHPIARPGPAPGGARVVWLRPPRRRHPRRAEPGNGRLRAGRKATGAVGPLLRRRPATSPSWSPSATPCAATGSPRTCSRTSSPRCAWTSPSLIIRTVRRSTATCAVRGSHWATDASDTGNGEHRRRGRAACGGAGPRVSAHQFLRDVDEDLTRNRIYLPADELAAFGVDRELMTWCHLHRRTDARVRDALAAQHHITRDIYRFAADGIALLAPRSRPCVATALTLYSEILDSLRQADFRSSTSAPPSG